MIEGNSLIMTHEVPAKYLNSKCEDICITDIGMYIRNIAYIPSNWKDISNADMNELSEIRLGSDEICIR